MIIINLSGAVAAGLYLEYINPLPSEQPVEGEFDVLGVAISTAFMIAIFAFAALMGSRGNRRIGRWYERIREGTPAAEAPDSVRREVLNSPVKAAVLTASMWLVAGLVVSFWEGGLRVFIGVTLIGGVVATAITFFANDLMNRSVVPIFFPDGKVSAVGGFRLPVFGRLLVAFFFAGVYLPAILAMLTWQRAQALLTAPDPQAVLGNLFAMAVFLLVMGVVASAGLALLVTRAITGPLNDLQSAMKRVEDDDLDAHVLVYTTDELGYLGEHFNEMVAGLRQARKLRNLLDLYVSPEVAREALRGGAELGGRQAECSVLFSDIRGFTSISERLSPHRLIALLNRYMMTMVEVIVANQGIVNKFGGDSLLAVFGTPLNPADDHAARAVCAARDMQQALAAFNGEQLTRQAPPLETGIGVATGDVIAGNVGGRERIEYTVLGDTVNLASRLQDKTKEIGDPILLSEQTFAHAGRDMPLQGRKHSDVPIKGKREPVVVYACS
jgi:adenylate cyclase